MNAQSVKCVVCAGSSRMNEWISFYRRWAASISTTAVFTINIYHSQAFIPDNKKTQKSASSTNPFFHSLSGSI